MTAPAADSGAPALGFFGGTFDPVHVGHVAAAQAVYRAFSLRRVLLLPAATPPHKTRTDFASARDRLRMLELAVEGVPGLGVCDLELRRGGTSYTIDSLRALRAGTPPVLPVFVLGMDALLDVASWREPRALVREFDLIAVDRPGRSLDEARGRLDDETFTRLLPAFPGPSGVPAPAPPLGTGGRIFILAIPPVPVSSSEVRSRASRREPLLGLVHPAVARYIQDQALYTQEAER